MVWILFFGNKFVGKKMIEYFLVYTFYFIKKKASLLAESDALDLS